MVELKEMKFSFFVAINIIALGAILPKVTPTYSYGGSGYTSPSGGGYTSSSGGSSGGSCDPDCIQNFLDSHNKARQEVGNPPLVWNTTLAEVADAYATQRAEDCALQHSGGPYGENIALACLEYKPEDSVKMFVDEKKYYNHITNACITGECLHYTQVVWKDTTSVGCGRVKCKTQQWLYVVCNYYPRGNIAGTQPYY